MPYGGPLSFRDWKDSQPPKVGKPHRDRKKAKRRRSGK